MYTVLEWRPLANTDSGFFSGTDYKNYATNKVSKKFDTYAKALAYAEDLLRRDPCGKFMIMEGLTVVELADSPFKITHIKES